MRKSSFIAGLIASTLITSACAPHIYKNRAAGLSGVQVLTTDAKQRHTYISKNGYPKLRMCAEASPDVFSAISSSFGADFTIGGAEQKAKAAGSIAESAASLERTQTINLLRESMYRTCERWLSGAISEQQFIIQAARDQQTMLSILAIEQLTGVAKRKSTIISGPGTAASVVSGEEAAALIKQFNAELSVAKTALITAQANLKTADEKGKCIANEAPPDGVTPEDWANCIAAKSVRNDRQESVDAAQARLDKSLNIAGQLVNNSNSSTIAGTNQQGGGSSDRIGDAALIGVALVVQNIANRSFDESLMFCIARLTDKVGEEEIEKEKLFSLDQRTQSYKQDDQITESCLRILENKAKADERRRDSLSSVGISDYLAPMPRSRQSPYLTFRNSLAAKINVTKEADLQKKMQTFEASSGSTRGLSASCIKKSPCVSAINADVFYLDYQRNRVRFESALAAW